MMKNSWHKLIIIMLSGAMKEYPTKQPAYVSDEGPVKT